MFVVALLIVAKIRKQARYLFIDRWIDKSTVVHPDNGILFSTKINVPQAMKINGRFLNSYY